MSLILAIEADRRQATLLASIGRRVGAELVIAPTAEGGLEAIAGRVPDLILTSALLSPRDDAAIAARLRELDTAASHVQMLTIPVLAKASRRLAQPGGLLGKLRGAAQTQAPAGCDPSLFAEQVTEYLQRAAAERDARQEVIETSLEPEEPPQQVEAATREPANTDEHVIVPVEPPKVDELAATEEKQAVEASAPEPIANADAAATEVEPLATVVAAVAEEPVATFEVAAAEVAPPEAPIATLEIAAGQPSSDLAAVELPVAASELSTVDEPVIAVELTAADPFIETPVVGPSSVELEPVLALEPNVVVEPFAAAEPIAGPIAAAERISDIESIIDVEPAAEVERPVDADRIVVPLTLSSADAGPEPAPVEDLPDDEEIELADELEPEPDAVAESVSSLPADVETALREFQAALADIEAAERALVAQESANGSEGGIALSGASKTWPTLEGITAESAAALAEPEVEIAPAPGVTAAASEPVPVPLRSVERRSEPRPAPRRPVEAARCTEAKPAQDEWGMFDPNQCGFAALLEKLERIAASADDAA